MFVAPDRQSFGSVSSTNCHRVPVTGLQGHSVSNQFARTWVSLVGISSILRAQNESAKVQQWFYPHLRVVCVDRSCYTTGQCHAQERHDVFDLRTVTHFHASLLALFLPGPAENPRARCSQVARSGGLCDLLDNTYWWSSRLSRVLSLPLLELCRGSAISRRSRRQVCWHMPQSQRKTARAIRNAALFTSSDRQDEGIKVDSSEEFVNATP